MTPLLIPFCGFCYFDLTYRCKRRISRSRSRNRNRSSRKRRVIDLNKELVSAAKNGHVGKMKLCVYLGANLHYVQKNTGMTIFHFASQGGDKKATQWCCRKSLSINALDSMKRSPLLNYMERMGLPTVDILKNLINAGAGVSIKGVCAY